METNTNCRKGLDFELMLEKQLQDNNIPYLSQVDFDGISSRCDIIIATQPTPFNYNVYNFSLKTSLRERYKLSGFEQCGLRELYKKKSKTYIVTPSSREAENLKKKIPTKIDLKKNITDVICEEDFITFIKKLPKIVNPDIDDIRIENYNVSRSNIIAK